MISACSHSTLASGPRRAFSGAPQGLQTTNVRSRRDRTCNKRERSCTRGARARYPTNGTRNEFGRKNAASVVHDDREDRPQEEADEGDADGAGDQVRHEPNDELESVRVAP